jgi:hypothetical protein
MRVPLIQRISNTYFKTRKSVFPERTCANRAVPVTTGLVGCPCASSQSLTGDARIPVPPDNGQSTGRLHRMGARKLPDLDRDRKCSLGLG